MADATTVDADTSSDADVAAALGLDSAGDVEQDNDGDVEGNEDQESDQSEELAQLRRELATLRRENAERRIKEREAKAKPADDGDESKDLKAAREAGREEARAEHGIELTKAKIGAALTGIVPDDTLDEFLQDLNISRYVGDDHKPDLDAIAALKDRQAKLIGGKRTTRTSNGRTGGGTTAKSNADQFGDIVTGLLGK